MCELCAMSQASFSFIETVLGPASEVNGMRLSFGMFATIWGSCLLAMALCRKLIVLREIASPVELLHCLVSPLHTRLREIEREDCLNS